MDMTVYIPTFRRLDRQETWSWLPEAVRENAYLVAVPDEAESLDLLGYNVLECPEQGIANTRQWILDQHDVSKTQTALMLDDDLGFSVRRADDPTKFYKPEKGGAEVLEMFNLMDEMMQHVALGGIAARSGANRVTEPYRLNSRLYDTWAVNVETARAIGLQINRLEFMEDFDAALQFLSQGYPSLLLNTHVKDDRGSNVAGGCSTYRDEVGQAMAAMRLKELWPDFVTVTERPAWNGMEGTRTDVRVGWAKAFKAGVESRDFLGVDQEPELDWSDGSLRRLDTVLI